MEGLQKLHLFLHFHLHELTGPVKGVSSLTKTFNVLDISTKFQTSKMSTVLAKAVERATQVPVLMVTTH